jgi:Subtilase family
LTRHTWRASVTASGAAALAQAEGIQSADLIRPEDKFSNAAKPGAAPHSDQLRAQNRVAYSVLFHKDVTAEEVRAFAGRANIRLENFDADAFSTVRAVIVSLPPSRLPLLSTEDIVAWIEPSPTAPRPHNVAHSQKLSNVDIVQAAPYNLDGSGITVGIWESGSTISPSHLDLAPRVIVQPGQNSKPDDHAMHVAGTIGASGAHVKEGRGMAPKATIHSWNARRDAGEMAKAAASGQILVSNHSYGLKIGWPQEKGRRFVSQDRFGEYTNNTHDFDNIVFLHKLIVVKSAGNDRNDEPPARAARQPPRDCTQGGLGVDADCIGPLGVAKNVITVGAMDGTKKIGTFSSFGPTDDGRIKPDVMAQGVNVISLGAASDTAKSKKSGTSMAAPVVTGIAALVLQDAKARNIAMTPAAMKALLVQTAHDVQGIKRATPGPDYATGWGIVDAKAAIDLLRQSGLAQATLSATGSANAWTRTFAVAAGLSELHITLAWDDPPATSHAEKTLIHDLDLRLIAPDGTEFSPWILDPAKPAQAAVRNGGNDDVNNVEQVSVLNPMAGLWTARVSPAAGNLPMGPQAFAIAGMLP